LTLNLSLPQLTLAEFKEIRKEWKAKKKEEEAARKAAEERQAAERQNAPEGSSSAQVYGAGPMRTPLGPPIGGPQLPPIGYGGPPGSGQSQSAYGAPSPAMEGMQYVTSSTLNFGESIGHASPVIDPRIAR
jgi:transcription factor CON7